MYHEGSHKYVKRFTDHEYELKSSISMQNEETAGLPGELHTIVKRSLHARKWATISQRGTLSNTSGAVSLDEADSAVSGESWSVSPLPEEREEVIYTFCFRYLRSSFEIVQEVST